MIIISVIAPIIIYFMKKDESVLIKTHARQAMMLFVAVFVILIGLGITNGMFLVMHLGILSLLLLPIQLLIGVGFLAYIIILGLQVYQGSNPEIPYISQMVQKP